MRLHLSQGKALQREAAIGPPLLVEGLEAGLEYLESRCPCGSTTPAWTRPQLRKDRPQNLPQLVAKHPEVTSVHEVRHDHRPLKKRSGQYACLTREWRTVSLKVLLPAEAHVLHKPRMRATCALPFRIKGKIFPTPRALTLRGAHERFGVPLPHPEGFLVVGPVALQLHKTDPVPSPPIAAQMISGTLRRQGLPQLARFRLSPLRQRFQFP